MFLRAAMLGVFLMGCSGSVGSSAGEPVPSGPAPATGNDATPGDVGTGEQPDAGSPSTPDSAPPVVTPDAGSPPVVIPPIDYSVCGSSCGDIGTDGYGRAIDCGGCAAQSNVPQGCGDNGRANKCGSVCFNTQDDITSCSEMAAVNHWGFQPTWAIPQTCTGEVTYRSDNGTDVIYRSQGVHSGMCVDANLPNGHRVSCCAGN